MVTGATGLIGSEVVGDLIPRFGARNVYGIDRSARSGQTFLGENLILADVSKSEIVDLLDEISPQLIVHAAAHPGGKSLQDPALNVEANALGSMRIFEWSAKNSCRILYLSSSIVYGEAPPIPIKEEFVLRPATVYGVAKAACEQWLRILTQGFGLDWVVLRPFSTYGAGHGPSLDQGIVNVMITQMATTRDLLIKGSLTRLRDLVYVSDASDAICRTVETWPSQKVLNVCTGVATSIKEIIETIADVRGIDRSDFLCNEIPGTVGDPQYNVGDPTFASNTIGFRSRMLPRDGIAHLLSLKSTFPPGAGNPPV